MKKRQRKKIARQWEKNSVRLIMGVRLDHETGRWSIRADGLRVTRQTRRYGREQREMTRRMWFSPVKVRT